jgi:hypothetical protein
VERQIKDLMHNPLSLSPLLWLNLFLPATIPCQAYFEISFLQVWNQVQQLDSRMHQEPGMVVILILL